MKAIMQICFWPVQLAGGFRALPHVGELESDHRLIGMDGR
jgi:hypothetical protein